MERGINEIIEIVRGKQKVMNDILALTKEIQESFGENESERAELALDHRMEKILEAQECDERIEEIFDYMDIGEALRITRIMRLQTAHMSLTTQEKILLELYTSMKATVDLAIAIDKEISTKIAGRQSIYAQRHTEIT